MAETSDYDPGPWKGHVFDDARKAYDRHAGRSYTEAISAGKKALDMLPDKLTTKSESPLVIACDVTGSMGEWPATIFSKLPYLDKEGKEYLGDKAEISFCAIGDCFSDKYPLQVREFVSGTDLEKELKALIIEGGGGGSTQESYDLAAKYYTDNVEMPNAVRKPIFIFIGDEGLYDKLKKENAKFAKVSLEDHLKIDEIIEDLQKRYSVYLVRKTYPGTREKEIKGQWIKLLGEDHVCALQDAQRVVDVIFGILAKETGRVDYFHKEIEGRQKPEQVNVVMTSLKTVHGKLAAPASMKKLEMKSITRRKKGDEEDDAKPTKSLI
jgi:hypothetical protein